MSETTPLVSPAAPVPQQPMVYDAFLSYAHPLAGLRELRHALIGTAPQNQWLSQRLLPSRQPLLQHLTGYLFIRQPRR
jgi:hypothetical protein